MIVNELKPLLGEGWREKFVHRDLWDPEGYGVASFDLGGEKEKVLAMNFETEDIMNHFFDDLDLDWINIDRAVEILLGEKQNHSYYIDKNYNLKKDIFGQIRPLTDKVYPRTSYPVASISGVLFPIHRLIAAVFVPNPDPDKFSFVNHIDLTRTNFKKENLEWCDITWNNQTKNRKPLERNILYERLSDKRRFTKADLLSEYPNVNNPVSSITTVISKRAKWKGSYWKTIDVLLEDYLAKHPLRDDWYPHPTLPNVRANGCGVLEIDGKLRIGSKIERGAYYIRFNKIKTHSHRIILECYLGRILQPTEFVDHINPISEIDTDNSKENLRVCSRTENRLNPITAKKFYKAVKVFDLRGNLTDTLESFVALRDKYKINSMSFGKNLVFKRKYIINDTSRLNYIYYKWKINRHDGTAVCIGASRYLRNLYTYSSSGAVSGLRKKYLNTGMPAPDGFYYQQGDPWNMIYDPDNKDLIKKRPEICWKDNEYVSRMRKPKKDKNNNEEGNQ